MSATSDLYSMICEVINKSSDACDEYGILEEEVVRLSNKIENLESRIEDLNCIHCELEEQVGLLTDELESKTRLVDELAAKYNHSFI